MWQGVVILQALWVRCVIVHGPSDWLLEHAAVDLYSVHNFESPCLTLLLLVRKHRRQQFPVDSSDSYIGG